MKNKSAGVIQLILCIVVILLFNAFFFKVLSLIGLHFSGTAFTIANFIKHLLVTIIVFVIYSQNIKSGKNKFSSTWLNSFIYCVSCFVFLLVVTVLLHKGLNYLGNPRGITIPYNFTNYFSTKFTLDSALNLVIDAILLPFLLCVVFPLGFSNIFKKSGTASFLAGLTYGVVYAISLNTSIERALFLSLTSSVLVMLLTYLYKTNHNIWSVIITYICYVLFGIFAINYIV